MKLYNLESFGKNIADLRRQRGLTQEDVYSTIGISPDTLRRIENGYSIPKLETIELLSIVYKVDLHMILSKHRLSYKYIFSDDLISINKLIALKEIDLLEKHIQSITKIVNEESSKANYELILVKFKQFKETIILVNDIPELKEGSATIAIQRIVNLIKMSIPAFELELVHTFHYDYIEMRLLLILSEILRSFDLFKECKFTLIALEENVNEIIPYNRDFYEILLKVYFHQSTLYFRIDNFRKSLESAQKGVEISKEINDCSLMQHFLGRIGTCYYYLNDYLKSKNYFNLSLNLVEIYDSKVAADKQLQNYMHYYPKAFTEVSS